MQLAQLHFLSLDRNLLAIYILLSRFPNLDGQLTVPLIHIPTS